MGASLEAFKYCNKQLLKVNNAYKMEDGGVIAKGELGNTAQQDWFYKPHNSNIFFEFRALSDLGGKYPLTFEESGNNKEGQIVFGNGVKDGVLTNSNGQTQKITAMTAEEKADLQQSLINKTFRADEQIDRDPMYLLYVDGDKQKILIVKNKADSAITPYQVFLFDKDQGVREVGVDRLSTKSGSDKADFDASRSGALYIGTDMGVIDIPLKHGIQQGPITLNDVEVHGFTTYYSDDGQVLNMYQSLKEKGLVPELSPFTMYPGRPFGSQNPGSEADPALAREQNDVLKMGQF